MSCIQLHVCTTGFASNISLKHHKIQESSGMRAVGTIMFKQYLLPCKWAMQWPQIWSQQRFHVKFNVWLQWLAIQYNQTSHEDKDYIIIKMFWSKTSGHAMEWNQLIRETALPPFPTVSYIRHTRPSEKTVDQTIKINFNVTVVTYMQFALYWLNTSDHHQHNDKLPCVLWNTWNQLQHNDNSCHGCMEHLKSTSTQWPQLYGTPEINFNIMTIVAICCMEGLKSTSVQWQQLLCVVWNT